MKNPLNKVQLTKKLHRTKLIARKNAPHIAFGVGVVGAVGATVLACRATLKLSDTLTEIEQDLGDARDIPMDPNLSDDEDRRRQISVTYVKSGVKLIKLYAPAAGVGVVSIGLLTGSHVAMTRRNTALMAAYAAVSKSLEDYRQRVGDELGPEREEEVYKAFSTPSEYPAGASPYARLFDEASPSWEKNAEYNRIFIECQQNYANQLLRARGHLFLNEVYDALGLERTKEGAVTGWVIGKGDEHPGDNYVDFGMYGSNNQGFIEGSEPRVVLDFNVDGIIWDKI